MEQIHSPKPTQVSPGPSNFFKREDIQVNDYFFKPAYLPHRYLSEAHFPVIQRKESESKPEEEGSNTDFSFGKLVGALTGLAGPFVNTGIAYAGLGFPSGLPANLLRHYTIGGGLPYVLTEAEMRECKPHINLFDDINFTNAIAEVKGKTNAKFIASKVPAVAHLGGTLNQFTVRYFGQLSVLPDGKVNFAGYMSFYDKYDFDRHSGASRRSGGGQFRTGFGTMMAGNPFSVTSQTVDIEIKNNSPLMW